MMMVKTHSHNSYSKELESKYLKSLEYGLTPNKPTPKNHYLFKLKPKIPKSGNSLYGDYYIRKLQGLELIYHRPTSIFVAVTTLDAKSWIDENINEIERRVSLCTN